jgi:hypothetical protein
VEECLEGTEIGMDAWLTVKLRERTRIRHSNRLNPNESHIYCVKILKIILLDSLLNESLVCFPVTYTLMLELEISTSVPGCVWFRGAKDRDSKEIDREKGQANDKG